MALHAVTIFATIYGDLGWSRWACFTAGLLRLRCLDAFYRNHLTAVFAQCSRWHHDDYASPRCRACVRWPYQPIRIPAFVRKPQPQFMREMDEKRGSLTHENTSVKIASHPRYHLRYNTHCYLAKHTALHIIQRVRLGLSSTTVHSKAR